MLKYVMLMATVGMKDFVVVDMPFGWPFVISVLNGRAFQNSGKLMTKVRQDGGGAYVQATIECYSIFNYGS